MGTLDTLYVDLSLRGHGEVISGLGRVRAAMQGIGKSLAISNLGEIKSLIGAGGITALVGAGTVKAAADLEQARLGLKRFVDTDFSGLSDGIDKMSLKIPVSVQGLYDIASGAAQVGVSGTANILKFSETIGKLATVSHMSFGDTSKDLAKVLNVMQLSPDKAGKVGNIIAGLSAASAADPGELITMMKQISGTGSVLGMKVEDIGALSAGIKDAGANSEVAGTAINKMFGDMIENSAQFSTLLGVTEKEFRALRNADPFKAMMAALKAIAVQPTLEDKFAAEKSLGIESTRTANVTNMMLRVLEKTEQHRALAGRLGSDKNETELNKQFNTAAEGTYAKLQKLGNAIMLVSDQLGGGLSRAVGNAADAITNAVLSLKEPGRVNVGIGGGGPGQQMNMGVAPPGGQRQLPPPNMGVNPGAKPVGAPAEKKNEEIAEKLFKASEAERASLEATVERRKKMVAAIDDSIKWLNESTQRAIDAVKMISKRGEDPTALNEAIDATLKMIENKQAARTIAVGMLEKAKAEAAVAKPVIPAAAYKPDPADPGELIKKGGRKFAFDEMVDPKGFQGFRNAFLSLPPELMNSEAGDKMWEKMKARRGANVAKNMTEEELTNIVGKRAAVMENLTNQVAQERTQRLYAKPQFRGADEAYKQYAAGGAEGSGLERALKEQTTLQKEQKKAQDELNQLFKEFKVEWKDAAIFWSG